MKYYITLSVLFFSYALLHGQATHTVTIRDADGNTQIVTLEQDSADASEARETRKAENSIKHDTVPRHKIFTISTDLAQYFLFQPNIDFEYRVCPSFAIGGNFGFVEPSLVFAQNPVTDVQYKDPGSVYTGTAVRIYFKWYTGKLHRNYWCFQGVYKKLSYQGVQFSDTYDGGQILNMYTMNETATLYGGEIIHGHQLTKKGDHFNADLFYGMGLHQRYRSYTVTSESEIIAPGADYTGVVMITPGNYSSVLSLVTPVVGLKLGWNYLKHD